VRNQMKSKTRKIFERKRNLHRYRILYERRRIFRRRLQTDSLSNFFGLSFVLKSPSEPGNLDRVEIDQNIRQALRLNEPEKIRFLALLHPLRPLAIHAFWVQKALIREGFILIPGTRNLFLPPEGVSRREAKKRRDKKIREFKKWEETETNKSLGLEVEFEHLKDQLLKALGLEEIKDF